MYCQVYAFRIIVRLRPRSLGILQCRTRHRCLFSLEQARGRRLVQHSCLHCIPRNLPPPPRKPILEGTKMFTEVKLRPWLSLLVVLYELKLPNTEDWPSVFGISGLGFPKPRTRAWVLRRGGGESGAPRFTIVLLTAFLFRANCSSPVMGTKH